MKKAWQLAILKISPEALSYSHAYLGGGIGLNILLSYLMMVFFPITAEKMTFTPIMAIVIKAVNLFFLAFFLYLILKITKKTNRFLKLYLAIVLGLLVIELVNAFMVMIPVFCTDILKVDLSHYSGLTLILTMMMFMTAAWMIVFMGHVFRFGLEVSRLKGTWIGIMYVLISGIFSMMILGNPFKELI